MIKSIKDYFDQDKKDLKEIMKTVEKINSAQLEIKDLSNEELQEKTIYFREEVANGETLDSLLPEVFAVVKEAAKRTLGYEHFDEQLLVGILLHNGNVAEMKTGEGKTLVSTLPAYLNSLAGQSVHIFTVNDYLAKRDAEWMKPLYSFLGLTTSYILTSSSYKERQNAYHADIVYGTSNEFGFDYLRSNMAKQKEHLLIQEFNMAIVDEADTILIDESSVPLSLSDLDDNVSEDYYEFVSLIEHLEKDTHFELNEKELKANLTDEGIEKIESLLDIQNLYSAEHIIKVNKIQNALIAKEFLHIEKDYVVQDDKIVMIDFFTGRLMPGRRFADGIQQSIEAKEGVTLSPEFIVKGSITYQNLLKKYNKVSGMSGTAKTELSEFMDSYGLHVYEIPTHHPLKRVDYHDVIFKTKQAKYKAILKEIKEVNELGRPVLLGTESVDESEEISKLLTQEGLEHHVLNAKNHSKEAAIIANAGEKSVITIITNMAGRGTDIKLGEGVNELGGLHVIGTTRHGNRRIDNQLRGRAGRQGDNGSSRIYVSLEDDLIKRYGGEQVRVVLNKIKLSDELPIEHPMATKLVEQMQIQSEASSSNLRKFIKQYDDILDNQRNVLYESRQNLLLADSQTVKDQLFSIYEDVITDIVLTYCEGETNQEWDLESVVGSLKRFFFQEDFIEIDELVHLESREEIINLYVEKAKFVYNRKESHVGLETLANIVHTLLLGITDKNWLEHISTMEYMRQGLGVRGKLGNPFVDFSIESHDLFDEMIFSIKEMAMLHTITLELQIQPKE